MKISKHYQLIISNVIFVFPQGVLKGRTVRTVPQTAVRAVSTLPVRQTAENVRV